MPKLSRAAFFAGLLLVTVLSLLPRELVAPVPFWDKANHLAAYGALALAGGFGFQGKGAIWRVGLGLLVLGGVLEVAQTAVPGRYASLADLAANLIGIALGSLLALGLRAVWAKRQGTVAGT